MLFALYRIRNSVSALHDGRCWVVNAPELTKDLMPNEINNGITLYSVYTQGILSGLPSNMDGWLITFQKQGQIKEFFFGNNGINIACRYANDKSAKWQPWHFINFTS